MTSSTTSEKGDLKAESGTTTPAPGRKSPSILEDPEKDAGILSPSVPNDSAPQEEWTRPYTPWRWVLVLVALYLAAFLYGLDNTIVADVQGPVIETFGNVDKIGWLGIGFPLGSIATLATFGKAYSIFDIKWLFNGSLIMFIAGSALCGGAPSMTALIIGRVWAGAGGSGMYLGILNILTINTNSIERSMYMSGCGLVWGIGCILGPVIGGSFADSSATWRWAFYINLILYGILCPVGIFFIRSINPQPDKTFFNKLRHIDWVGSFLNAGLYTFFASAFTFGGAVYAWNDGKTIAFIVLFAVFLIAFALQQTYMVFTTFETRIFPIDFIKDRTLVLLYIAQSAAATSLFIPIYYTPLFFQFTRGDSGTDSAVRLLPFIFLVIAAILLNGFLMPRFGYYMPWFLVAPIFTLVGSASYYALVDASISAGKIYGFGVLMGIGAGLSQQSSYSVAPTQVEPHRISDALNFINSAQIGGFVIALTLTSSIFQNIGFSHVSAALAGRGFTPADIHLALAGAKSDLFADVPDSVRQAVIDGIVKSIGNGYILVITAAAVGLIAALCMKREKLFMEVGAGG
ncbi:MFS general substrate transporter [Eremomyces bilateralis CBS 781.70]|uniref:MFS general substrate transporter n=1 Tax=Eremomyces bilateralis CBS 781.70 TaxID=1392243 RepID=A0A6G1GCA2_9PEZI|nr:MFS general substrate transporter [Eremomyces bilateralis CBS 781.70]KAF1815531.1 MFS general substrate transporter [Eremomyces bilateralis CBS 781.70]